MHVLCWCVKLTSTSLCLGEWLIISHDLNENIMSASWRGYPKQIILLGTWCVLVFIQLAAAYAWVNGSSTAMTCLKILCLFYGEVIQNSSFLLVHVLCWCVELTSTSLCLGEWLINSYDLNENIMSVLWRGCPKQLCCLGTYFVLVYLTN